MKTSLIIVLFATVSLFACEKENVTPQPNARIAQPEQPAALFPELFLNGDFVKDDGYTDWMVNKDLYNKDGALLSGHEVAYIKGCPGYLGNVGYYKCVTFMSVPGVDVYTDKILIPGKQYTLKFYLYTQSVDNLKIYHDNGVAIGTYSPANHDIYYTVTFTAQTNRIVLKGTCAYTHLSLKQETF